MLKFKTSCAVLAYLSSNLLNEVGLSLFRYFEVGLRVCDIVVKKFTFAISSPDEFLFFFVKAAALKQQISKFYPQIQHAEASHHIYFSQRPVINVKATCSQQRKIHSANVVIMQFSR